MREPPLNVRVLGHPLTMATVGLGGMTMLYASYQMGGEGILPAIITLILMASVSKAHDHMNGYRAWKRAWDGMAGSQATRASSRGRKMVGVAAIALVAVYVAAHADQPDYALALGWMMLVAVVGGMVALWRLARRGSVARAKTAPADAVAICARPVVRVPSLAGAHQAMPAYCHRLMAR